MQERVAHFSFNTTDGDRCSSETEITLTYCEGYCSSYDALRIRPVYGQGSPVKAVIHDIECGCCIGLGDWVKQPVVCERAGAAVVERYNYTSCRCLTCQSTEALT